MDENALLAYYKFEDNVKDFSKNSLDLTFSGTDYSYITGQVNKSLSFGSSSITYASAALDTELDNLTNWSIAFWMRYKDTPSNYQTILEISSGSVSTRTAMIYFSSTNLVIEFYDAAQRTLYYDLNATTIDTDQQWHHFVALFDGTNIKLYIDKSLVATSSDFSLYTPYATPSTLYLSDRDSIVTFDIDEVRIFNKAISQFEINELYGFNGNNEIIINNEDFSFMLIDYEAHFIFGQVKKFNFVLNDENNYLRNKIKFNDQCDFYINGTKTWRAIIIDAPKILEYGEIQLIAYSKEFLLLRRFITVSYTSQTLSYIIKDIIDTYFSGLFTYNNVKTTTNTYTFTRRGVSVFQLIQYYAAQEDLQFFVDEDDDLHLTGLTDRNSGLVLDYDNQGNLYDPSFPTDAKSIFNSIIVYSKMKKTDGTAGIAVRYRNTQSIAKYGVIIEAEPETTDLETMDECIAYARQLIDDLAFVLEEGTFWIDVTPSLDVGETLLISLQSKNFSNKQFIIKEIKHSPTKTEIAVAEVESSTSKLLRGVLNSLRRVKDKFKDSDSVISDYEQDDEKIYILFNISTTRVLKGPRKWRQSQWRQFSWLGGTETEITGVNNEKMVLTNAGKKKILDILTGVSSVLMDETNTFIGLGTGTTTETVNDTALEAEVDIKAGSGQRGTNEIGFPRRDTDSKVTYQAVITDTDLLSQTFNEIGLFDADTGGVLYTRKVTSVAFAKNANEDLVVSITLEVKEA